MTSAKSASCRNGEQLLGDLALGCGVGLGDDGDQRRAQARPARRRCSGRPGRPAGRPGTQNPTTSTSVSVARTTSLSRSPSRVRGRCRPGVSTMIELRVVAVDDAAHRVPGGLRLVAGDDDLAADQRVGQRRLPGVGTADEARKTRPMHSFTIRAGPNVDGRARMTVPRSRRGEDIVRVALRCAAVLGALTVLSACTHGRRQPTPRRRRSSSTQIVTRHAVATADQGRPADHDRPDHGGRGVHVCPYVDEQAAANKIGHAAGQDHRAAQRRQGGRLPVLRPAAPTPAASTCRRRAPARPEPTGGRDRDVRYPSAKAAHNAFVADSERPGHERAAGRASSASAGLCFQTDFYPKDQGTDWACAFSNGKRWRSWCGPSSTKRRRSTRRRGRARDRLASKCDACTGTAPDGRSSVSCQLPTGASAAGNGGDHPRRLLARPVRPVAGTAAGRRSRAARLRGVESRVPPRRQRRRLAGDLRRRRGRDRRARRPRRRHDARRGYRAQRRRPSRCLGGGTAATPGCALSGVVSQAGVLGLVRCARDGSAATAALDLMGGSPDELAEQYRLAIRWRPSRSRCRWCACTRGPMTRCRSRSRSAYVEAATGAGGSAVLHEAVRRPLHPDRSGLAGLGRRRRRAAGLAWPIEPIPGHARGGQLLCGPC